MSLHRVSGLSLTRTDNSEVECLKGVVPPSLGSGGGGGGQGDLEWTQKARLRKDKGTV